MFKLIIVGTIAAVSFAQTHPINSDIVEEIKSKTSMWTPMDPATNPLGSRSVGEIMGLLGTHIQGPANLPAPEVSADLADNFDSRTQWPDCVH